MARRDFQRPAFPPRLFVGVFRARRSAGTLPPSVLATTVLIRKIQFLTLCFTLPLTVLGNGREGASLTLRDALARTLRGSPDLAAFNYDLRAAEARVLQSGLRPNPELAYEIENPTGSGAYKNADLMENTVRLSQVIELGGKRTKFAESLPAPTA